MTVGRPYLKVVAGRQRIAAATIEKLCCAALRLNRKLRTGTANLELKLKNYINSSLSLNDIHVVVDVERLENLIFSRQVPGEPFGSVPPNMPPSCQLKIYGMRIVYDGNFDTSSDLRSSEIMMANTGSS